MKKILMLFFIGLVITVTIFVYESVRNPVIRVILPAGHGLAEGAPLIYDNIAIGKVISIQRDKINGAADESETAKIRLKGDIYDLIYEEDTFFVKDNEIHIRKDRERKTPISRGYVVKSTLYKSIYQYLVVGFDDLKETVTETIRNESSRLFDESIDKIRGLMEEKKENVQAEKILQELKNRLDTYSKKSRDELIQKKDEISSYIEAQINELKSLNSEDAVKALEELKEKIASLSRTDTDTDDKKEE